MGSTCTISKQTTKQENNELQTEANKQQTQNGKSITNNHIIEDDQSQAAIEEDIKTQRHDLSKRPQFFTNDIVKDVQRLRTMLQIDEILTFRNTYRALCKVLNPVEFQSITQEMLECPDDEFIEFQDKVFFRSVLGDYYCYKATKEDDDDLIKQLQLKASRFYNDASIISKETLEPNNSWRLFIGLKLAVFVAFMENNIYTASQIAQETLDICNQNTDNTEFYKRTSTSKSTKNQQKLQSKEPVITKLKYFIDKWEKKLEYMRMETEAANLLKSQNNGQDQYKDEDQDDYNHDYEQETKVKNEEQDSQLQNSGPKGDQK